MAQLMLFEPTEEQALMKKMDDLEAKYHNLRKGQYAKLTGLQKEVKGLVEQMELLNANICKNGWYT